jgi:predicted Zn-dependent protease
MPAASARLAVPLLAGANARVTLEGLTYLSGQVGRKLAGDEITIWSDPQHPDLPYLPFDAEGIPRRRVTWIDRGVFGQMWWDRWTARQNGVEPVPLPGSLCMTGTDRSVEDLIGGIERGILVTHIWYVRSVKEDQTLVTGLTRDGTFWIEEGRIRHPVRNLRFNDTALGMMQRTTDIGSPQRCVGPETFPSVFPPLVVRDWNFVGVTDF